MQHTQMRQTTAVVLNAAHSIQANHSSGTEHGTFQPQTTVHASTAAYPTQANYMQKQSEKSQTERNEQFANNCPLPASRSIN